MGALWVCVRVCVHVWLSTEVPSAKDGNEKRSIDCSKSVIGDLSSHRERIRTWLILACCEECHKHEPHPRTVKNETTDVFFLSQKHKPGISCQRETQPLPGVIMATTPLKDAVVYLSTMTSLSRAFVSASKKTQLLQPSWMNCSWVLMMWHRRHARRFFVLSGMTIARVGGLGFSVCGLFAMCFDGQ